MLGACIAQRKTRKSDLKTKLLGALPFSEGSADILNIWFLHWFSPQFSSSPCPCQIFWEATGEVSWPTVGGRPDAELSLPDAQRLRARSFGKDHRVRLWVHSLLNMYTWVYSSGPGGNSLQGLHVLFVVLIYGMFTLYRMAMSKKLLETPHGLQSKPRTSTTCRGMTYHDCTSHFWRRPQLITWFWTFCVPFWK